MQTKHFVGHLWHVNADILVGHPGAQLRTRKLTVVRSNGCYETIKGRLQELRRSFNITGRGKFTVHDSDHVSWTQHETGTQIHAWLKGEVWEHHPIDVLSYREKELYKLMLRGNELPQSIKPFALPLFQASPELDAYHHALAALLRVAFTDDEVTHALDVLDAEAALKRRAEDEGRVNWDDLPWFRTLEQRTEYGPALAALLNAAQESNQFIFTRKPVSISLRHPTSEQWIQWGNKADEG